MRNNIVYFPNKEELRTDDMLISEIRGLISQFKNPDLSLTTREEIFNKIIDLTNQLTK